MDLLLSLLIIVAKSLGLLIVLLVLVAYYILADRKVLPEDQAARRVAELLK